jgi:hypothetical protein
MKTWALALFPLSAAIVLSGSGAGAQSQHDAVSLLSGSWLGQCTVKKDDNFGLPASFSVKALVRITRNSAGKPISMSFTRQVQTDAKLTDAGAQAAGDILSYFVDGVSPFTLNDFVVKDFTLDVGNIQVKGDLMTSMNTTSSGLSISHSNVSGEDPATVTFETKESVVVVDENSFKTSSDTSQDNMMGSAETQIDCLFKRTH